MNDEMKRRQHDARKSGVAKMGCMDIDKRAQFVIAGSGISVCAGFFQSRNEKIGVHDGTTEIGSAGFGGNGNAQLSRKHVPYVVGTVNLMQTSLMGIAYKAGVEKWHRFQNLFGRLNGQCLKETFGRLNKKSAPGIDRVTIREYGENLEGNVRDLVGRVKSGGYRAKLVRRKYIPKANGKLRPLGIPATEDKLLQVADGSR